MLRQCTVHEVGIACSQVPASRHERHHWIRQRPLASAAGRAMELHRAASCVGRARHRSVLAWSLYQSGGWGLLELHVVGVGHPVLHPVHGEEWRQWKVSFRLHCNTHKHVHANEQL